MGAAAQIEISIRLEPNHDGGYHGIRPTAEKTVDVVTYVSGVNVDMVMAQAENHLRAAICMCEDRALVAKASE